MTKKFISVFLAVLMSLSVFSVAAFAEEATESATGATYKISELLAAFAADTKLVIKPGDTIEIDNDTSEILIFDYETDGKDGSNSASAAGYKFFRDNDQRTGYTVKAIGETTTFADAVDNTNKPIDFANPSEYEFAGWTVKYVYSQSNYNKVIVVATWDIPQLTGWAGFMAMFRGYMKTLVDLLAGFVPKLLEKIKDYYG